MVVIAHILFSLFVLLKFEEKKKKKKMMLYSVLVRHREELMVTEMFHSIVLGYF